MTQLRPSMAFTLCWLIAPVATAADSETPPAGPPWQRSLVQAQRLALEGNKPIFVYFTKTY